VIAAVPVFVSLNAVIVAVPAPMAVTRPDAETVLMLVLLELQLTVRPVSTLLLASRVVAESCTVPPTWRLDVAGDTDTDATGTGAPALTVIADEEVIPSLEAVIVAEPAATAVASPDPETVATPVLLELQLITRPVSTVPLASRVIADSCTVPAICTLAVGGDTDIDATGTGSGALTLRDAEPVSPSLEAVIAAMPGATAAISPLLDTVATCALALCHVTVRFVREAPLASFSVTVARSVCPAMSDGDGSVIETDATCACVGISTTDDPSYEEQAATATTRPVTARIKARITRPPVSVIRRLDWHSALPCALASWLCVAGFRRVCLCRPPPREACDPAVLYLLILTVTQLGELLLLHGRRLFK
jgi:hypothetical protein